MIFIIYIRIVIECDGSSSSSSFCLTIFIRDYLFAIFSAISWQLFNWLLTNRQQQQQQKETIDERQRTTTDNDCRNFYLKNDVTDKRQQQKNTNEL